MSSTYYGGLYGRSNNPSYNAAEAAGRSSNDLYKRDYGASSSTYYNNNRTTGAGAGSRAMGNSSHSYGRPSVGYGASTQYSRTPY